jgi:hypothetical protein
MKSEWRRDPVMTAEGRKCGGVVMGSNEVAGRDCALRMEGCKLNVVRRGKEMTEWLGLVVGSRNLGRRRTGGKLMTEMTEWKEPVIGTRHAKKVWSWVEVKVMTGVESWSVAREHGIAVRRELDMGKAMKQGGEVEPDWSMAWAERCKGCRDVSWVVRRNNGQEKNAEKLLTGQMRCGSRLKVAWETKRSVRYRGVLSGCQWRWRDSWQWSGDGDGWYDQGKQMRKSQRRGIRRDTEDTR